MCPGSENATAGKVGEGKCYFVDSQQSNNWLALRVRNATHNFVYVESFGKTAMNMPITKHSEKVSENNRVGQAGQEEQAGQAGQVVQVEGKAGRKGKAKGVFKCVEGDLCQIEFYDYGPITSDYPHFPVVGDEARWALDNTYV